MGEQLVIEEVDQHLNKVREEQRIKAAKELGQDALELVSV